MPVQLAFPDSKLGFRIKLFGQDSVAAAGDKAAADKADRWTEGALNRVNEGETDHDAPARDGTVNPVAANGDAPMDVRCIDATSSDASDKDEAIADKRDVDEVASATAFVVGADMAATVSPSDMNADELSQVIPFTTKVVGFALTPL